MIANPTKKVTPVKLCITFPFKNIREIIEDT